MWGSANEAGRELVVPAALSVGQEIENGAGLENGRTTTVMIAPVGTERQGRL